MLEVSRLAIEVKSTGIKAATEGLDALAKAGERAEKSVAQLAPTTQKNNTVQQSSTKVTKTATSQAQKYVERLELQAVTLGKNRAETEKLRAVSKGLSEEQTRRAMAAGAAMDRYQASVDRANKISGIFNNTVKSMISAFLLYQAINIAKGIIQAGDAWQMFTARLKVATGSMNEAARAQQFLYEMAQNLRVPLEDSVRLYTRLVVPMQEVGKTAGDVRQVVEGVGLALQLNGATGAEASSVMLQFSQSMAAGRLNGQELNAVLEGAPPIIRAIRAELNRTGQGIGKTIKDMGAAGELTVDLITNALKNALPQWRKDFAELPITVDSALTIVSNAWKKTMGELNQDTQLNKRLTDALLALVDLMPVVRDVMVTGFTVIIESVKPLITALAAITAFKMSAWAIGATEALVGMATGARAAGTAVTILGVGVRALLGPIGLVITAATALYAAYKLWWDKAPDADKKTTDKLNGQSESRIEQLKKEMETELKRRKLMQEAENEIGKGKDDTQVTAEELEKLQSNILKIEERRNKAAAIGDKWGKIQLDNQIKFYQKALDQKKLDRDRVLAFEAENKATATRKKQEEELAKLREKYATQEEKRAEILKKIEKDFAGNDAAMAEAKALVMRKENLKISKALAQEENKHQKAIDKITDAIAEQLETQEMLNRAHQEGLDLDKLGEGAKLRIKYQREFENATDAVTKAQAKQRLESAKVLEQEELKTAAIRRSIDSIEDYNKALSAQNAALAAISESYDIQLRGLGMSDEARSRMEQRLAIVRKYAEQERELHEANRIAAIPNYEQQLALIKSGQQRELELYDNYYNTLREKQEDWTVGASKAWQEYLEQSRNVAEISENAFSNMFDTMEDALYQFVTTGKLNFSDLAKSIISDLTKIAIKAAATGIFQTLASAFMPTVAGTGFSASASGVGFGTGGGGGVGFQANGSSIFPNALGNAFNNGAVSKFANGGTFTNGIVNKPTNFSIGQMGEAGPEAIVPLARTSDGSLGVKQVGGAGDSPVIINQEFHISSDGAVSASSSEGSDQMARQMAEGMAQVARTEISKQLRPGGIIWNSRNNRTRM